MVVIKRGNFSSLSLKSLDSSTVFTRMNDAASKQLEMAIEAQVEKRVSELLEARKKAESASSSKGAFLANMSHEIRTPMNSILGYSQMLLREADLDANHREYLEKIVLSSRHLLSLVNDVLDLSRIEVGRMVVVDSVFDLAGLLKAVEVMLAPKAEEKGLRFEIRMHRDLPRYVDADEVKLRQILVNLVANAIKFTSRGHVIVSVEMKPASRKDATPIIQVSVEDTGPGIDEKNIERLFKPFEQLDDNDSGQTREGTGLGLAISREYARLLGGDITLESRTGSGSTFVLTVPVRIDREEDVVLASSERAGRVIGIENSGKGTRILAVDDNEDANQLTARFLSSIGFEMETAADGEEALARFIEFKPDLVLMDRRMPKMDGLEALRRIKNSDQGRSVPVIMITASVFDEDYRACMASGADAFIRKPYLEEELLGEISRLADVQYRYEARTEVAASAVSSEHLTGIPAEQLETISSSILKGDHEVLMKELDRLDSVEEGVCQTLRKMARSYQYDELLSLLPRIGKEVQTVPVSMGRSA